MPRLIALDLLLVFLCLSRNCDWIRIDLSHVEEDRRARSDSHEFARMPSVVYSLQPSPHSFGRLLWLLFRCQVCTLECYIKGPSNSYRKYTRQLTTTTLDHD